MKKTIATSLIVLLLTTSPVTAAVITAGNHLLLPNQPDQIIQIMVRDFELSDDAALDESLQGMHLRAMIGGGGLINGGVAGPIFKEPAAPPSNWDSNMFPGTIWDGFVDESVRTVFTSEYAQLFSGDVWIEPGADVSADSPAEQAVLINLVIDTTDYYEGTWLLKLSGTQAGDTQLLKSFVETPGDPPLYGMGSLPVIFENGSIQITSGVNSISNGSWNVDSTWDATRPTGPTAADVTAVANHIATVDSSGDAFSLSIDNGAVRADANLTVNDNVAVAADSTLTVNSTLSAASISVDGTLAGTGNMIAGTIGLNGLVAPGPIFPNLITPDTGVGTLTVDGTATLAASATYDVEVSLAAADAGTDLIQLSPSSSLQLGGTLDVTGIERDPDFWAADVSRTIVSSPDSGVSDAFNDIVPEFGTTIDAHIGQGAFLRDVIQTADGVDLELFIAKGGDTDGDGEVWLSDWLNFRPNFNSVGSPGLDWTDGDFDGDGKVWISDWLIFRPNFSTTPYHTFAAAAEAAAVPEPCTLAMLTAGLIGLALLGWHRRRA